MSSGENGSSIKYGSNCSMRRTCCSACVTSAQPLLMSIISSPAGPTTSRAALHLDGLEAQFDVPRHLLTEHFRRLPLQIIAPARVGRHSVEFVGAEVFV